VCYSRGSRSPSSSRRSERQRADSGCHHRAAGAFVVVVTVGLLVRAPLARVPENSIKLAVGLLLTSFRAFWAVEGAGIHWPGDDLFLPALLAYTTAVTFTLVRLLRRQHHALEPLGADA
jgi:uncharacterized membrane protein